MEGMRWTTEAASVVCEKPTRSPSRTAARDGMLPALGVATWIRLATRRAPAQVTGASRPRLRAAEAQVVADDETAHAVADQVEPRVRVARGLRQALEAQRQVLGALDEIAAPVVGEDGVARARADAGLVAGGVEQLEHVRVLGEAEGARQQRVCADHQPGMQVVAAAQEGQRAGQTQVVMADRVAEVQPGLAAVGPQQLAAAEARHEHHERRIAVARQRADDPRVEPLRAARAGRGATRPPRRRRRHRRRMATRSRSCWRHRSPRPILLRLFASPGVGG